jgi:hypothetical protein
MTTIIFGTLASMAIYALFPVGYDKDQSTTKKICGAVIPARSRGLQLDVPWFVNTFDE